MTAEHVISGAGVEDIRIWYRPTSSIIEKPAMDANLQEIGRLTFGVQCSFKKIWANTHLDTAILEFEDFFELPAPSSFYPFARSTPFNDWPEAELDGLSLVFYGFPVANSKRLGRSGNREFIFIGTAAGLGNYDVALNSQDSWAQMYLTSHFDRSKDFFFKYDPGETPLSPKGFSGCGIWILSENPGAAVWAVDPVLIGSIHRHLEGKSLLVATKIPAILEWLAELV